jgi:hypothetical protein
VTGFFVLRTCRKPRSGKIEALDVLIACYYKQTRIQFERAQRVLS